jgi:glycosyltransferase involved in cell wall biosynthesis
MMETICLNPKFSTTRLLIKGGPVSPIPFVAKGPDGGLRKAGYTKAAGRSNPVVCIITVTLNGVKFLEQTIESVLGLAYPNVEFIIIDGGSKDGTVDILLKYNEQIDYWVSEPDEGIYDAMNKGWSLANEQSFILYLGAGDTIISLPSNMAAYKSNQIIYGKVMLGAGKTFESKADFRLRLTNTLHHQALLINKSIHPGPPFDRKFKVYADFDFSQRLYKKGFKFVKSENFLSSASPAGASKTYYRGEMANIIRKNFGPLYAACFKLNGMRKRVNRILFRHFSKKRGLRHD